MSEEQQRQADIRAKCFHPSGQWVEFKPEEIEQSIVSRFEQMVVLYPERLAVKCGTETLTYAELNRAANRLAHAIAPQLEAHLAPIALLFAQGCSSVVAMLATFKLNCSCMPLDPIHPHERVVQKIIDAKPKFVITNSQYRRHHALDDITNSSVICIDLIEKDKQSDVCNKNLNVLISPYAPALMLYTSGSTGHPKQIVISHRALLHRVKRQTNTTHISCEDRYSCVHYYDSMAGLRDIFCALLNGAAVIFFDLNKTALTDLAQWAHNEAITGLGFVAPVFRRFLQVMPNQMALLHLRIIYLGGDKLYLQDVRLFKQRLPENVILCNTFGSTETVGAVCSYLFDANYQPQHSIETVPIGYAMADTHIQIIDPFGNPVAYGKVGEIVVTNQFLADGAGSVAQNTDFEMMTSESMPHRVERRYKTGDLGLQQADGFIFHLGRIDHQIKINGVRIEIEEIEHALWGTNWYTDLALKTHVDKQGEQKLTAYLVTKQYPAPTVSELRRYLSDKLLPVMIPSAFVVLQALPLNANGKVDVKALPDPPSTRPVLDVDYVAPRDSTERMLVSIWQAVLELDDIGIHDHFLDLGGDSLRATQIIARVLSQFQVSISPQILLAQPTIAAMSLLITQYQAKLVDGPTLESLLGEIENM